MAENNYRDYLNLTRSFLSDYWAVLRKKKTPKYVLSHYHRAFLVVMNLYPNKKLGSNSVYRRVCFLIIINIGCLLLSMICALPTTESIIALGDDLFFASGTCLIFVKVVYAALRAHAIDDLIKTLDYYDEIFRPQVQHETILYWKRICFILEATLFLTLFSLLVLMNVAISSVPFFIDQDLPFHAVYPFGWGNPQKHPFLYTIIYPWQSFGSMYNLTAIMFVDLIGINLFLQTGLNLKILCLEIRKLGELKSDDEFQMQFCKIVKYHQHIIRTVKKINKVFYGSFISQIIASFVVVSMSTFESMIADDPKQAVKFVICLIIVGAQLSMWCFAGNFVYVESLEVGLAAFEINDWHTRSVKIQRQIILLIQRSQDPLILVAKPFLPFTLATYTAILQQCYSILALMREVM